MNFDLHSLFSFLSDSGYSLVRFAFVDGAWFLDAVGQYSVNECEGDSNVDECLLDS